MTFVFTQHIDKVFKHKELQQQLVDAKLQRTAELMREVEEKQRREREFVSILVIIIILFLSLLLILKDWHLQPSRSIICGLSIPMYHNGMEVACWRETLI